MKNLDLISEELFNKIRGRFPSVTIGNAEGNVTNVPNEARFFDFDFKEGEQNLGKVSISVDDTSVSVMYSNNFIEGQDKFTKEKWYGFLKELRYFAKKRLLNFDTRDITKSNLNKRDYKFLATNSGDETMSESKLYGTSKISYQKVGEARIVIKHTESINQESAAGRTRSIGKIYIESADGERFMYPFKHLSGARAMARHVAEGGKPFDEFGGHIVGLSEEMSKLRKFNNYMGRSAVMAESLAGYVDAVKARISTVKKTIESLQKPKYYAETFAAYAAPMMEDVPTDVAENWIDQLTIKQFNEELADVFPYIYNLVSEANKAEGLGPDDLLGEADVVEALMKGHEKYHCKDCGCQMHNCKPDCDCKHDSHDEKGAWWEDKDGNGIPDVMEGSTMTEYENWADQVIDEGLEKEPKTPVGEYVLSMFDRDSGKFPKGETAVLTAIEKDYGEQYINPAKKFIEAIFAKFEQYKATNGAMLGEAGGEEIFLDFSKELIDVQRTDDTEEFTAKLDGLGYRAGSEEEIDLEGTPVNVKINAIGNVQEGEFEIVSVTGDDGTQYVLDETDTWDIDMLTDTFSNALATEDAVLTQSAPDTGTVMEPTVGQEEQDDLRRLAGL
jgi:hypothetical protein|tara:strand:+ start:360 stop:2201 length:1842 start_codon:yes stop_codon:yes gene_type:complete